MSEMLVLIKRFQFCPKNSFKECFETIEINIVRQVIKIASRGQFPSSLVCLCFAIPCFSFFYRFQKTFSHYFQRVNLRCVLWAPCGNFAISPIWGLFSKIPFSHCAGKLRICMCVYLTFFQFFTLMWGASYTILFCVFETGKSQAIKY